MNDIKRLLHVTGRSAEIDNITFSLLKYDHIGMSENEFLKCFVKMHIHTHSEIVVCHSDRAELVTPIGEVPLYKGDAVLIPHDYPHTMKNSRDTMRVWDALPFHCARVERGSSNDLWRKYKALLTSDTPLIFRGIGELAEDIRSLATTEIGSDSVASVLKLALLFDRLSEKKYEKLSSVLSSGEEKSSILPDDTRLDIINEIVSTRYTDNIDVNRVCADLYVSRRHLDRIVKKRFGATMRELINDNRLDLSRKILKDTSDSIEKISFTVGFTSKDSFHRAFVKKYGISPTEYRKQVK